MCDTASQFNDNLMIQFNEGKGYKRIRTIKFFFSLKIQEATSKSVAVTEKKENNMSNILYVPTKGIDLQKIPLLLT